MVTYGKIKVSVLVFQMEKSSRSKMAVLMTSLVLALLRSTQASCPTQCACSPSFEDVVCKHVDVFPVTMPETARNIEVRTT